MPSFHLLFRKKKFGRTAQMPRGEQPLASYSGGGRGLPGPAEASLCPTRGSGRDDRDLGRDDQDSSLTNS